MEDVLACGFITDFDFVLFAFLVLLLQKKKTQENTRITINPEDRLDIEAEELEESALETSERARSRVEGRTLPAKERWRKEKKKSVCSVNVHVPARGTTTGREVGE